MLIILCSPLRCTLVQSVVCIVAYKQYVNLQIKVTEHAIRSECILKSTAVQNGSEMTPISWETNWPLSCLSIVKPAYNLKFFFIKVKWNVCCVILSSDQLSILMIDMFPTEAFKMSTPFKKSKGIAKATSFIQPCVSKIAGEN